MMIAPLIWLSACLRADDQADVLHGDELLHLHHAGLFIDLDVGHLHAAHLAARQRAACVPRA